MIKTLVGTPDPDEPEQGAVTPMQISELQEQLNALASEHRIIVLPPGTSVRVTGDIKRISREIAALLNEAEAAGYRIAMDEEAVWIGFARDDGNGYEAVTSIDIIDGNAVWVGDE